MYRVTRCSEVVDLVLLDDGEHPVVPGDLVVEVLVVHRPTKRADQVVVVSDHDQLKSSLIDVTLILMVDANGVIQGVSSDCALRLG